MTNEICKHCGYRIAIHANDPYCDHLYYPENCDICTNALKKIEKGMTNNEFLEKKIKEFDNLFGSNRTRYVTPERFEDYLKSAIEEAQAEAAQETAREIIKELEEIDKLGIIDIPKYTARLIRVYELSQQK